VCCASTHIFFAIETVEREPLQRKSFAMLCELKAAVISKSESNVGTTSFHSPTRTTTPILLTSHDSREVLTQARSMRPLNTHNLR
jgi:hypothetical protein